MKKQRVIEFAEYDEGYFYNKSVNSSISYNGNAYLKDSHKSESYTYTEYNSDNEPISSKEFSSIDALKAYLREEKGIEILIKL